MSDESKVTRLGHAVSDEKAGDAMRDAPRARFDRFSSLLADAVDQADTDDEWLELFIKAKQDEADEVVAELAPDGALLCVLALSACAEPAPYVGTMSAAAPGVTAPLSAHFAIPLSGPHAAIAPTTGLEWTGEWLYIFVESETGEVAASVDLARNAPVAGPRREIGLVITDATGVSVRLALGQSHLMEMISSTPLSGTPDRWKVELHVMGQLG